MGIFEIVVIFVLFCVVWIATNIVWRMIESQLLIRRQEQTMDALYAKSVRLFARAIADYRRLSKEGGKDAM